ncbi:heparanase-like [Galendromus occidentalis]|uniref:Heparanase-like n=1 Tax=Galendromus occidentalis TaxID=34638 RepID=A0AAJ6QUT3_9ACAR|nr:heparanase-like [Galendromus occidentalis]
MSSLFLGHTIDASIITKQEWTMVNFDDEKLKQAMVLLAPIYVRFGGILSDHTIFAEKRPRDGGSQHRRKEKKHKKGIVPPDAYTIYGDDIDRLLKFTDDSGSRLLFCLNSHLHSDGKWNSSNAFQLVDYIISKNFTSIDFSVGNEPRRNYNISGIDIGKAVKALRRKLNKSPLHGSKIIAPDVSRLQKFGREFLNKTISFAGKHLFAASFHQYYVNGSNTTWRGLIHPTTLDFLDRKISTAQRVVKSSRKPETPLWITESGSAFGGGALGLSRSFVAALGYADKLGLAATRGISHVMRQSLFGGRYRLFNMSERYEPSPEYWVAYLFRLLNGEVVRAIRPNPSFAHLRCYCFGDPDRRTITAMFINVHTTEKYILRTSTHQLLKTQRWDYLVTSQGDPSASIEILVNKRLLKLPDDPAERFIPPKGELRSGKDVLVLPALSMAFSVYIMQNTTA